MSHFWLICEKDSIVFIELHPTYINYLILMSTTPSKLTQIHPNLNIQQFIVQTVHRFVGIYVISQGKRRKEQRREQKARVVVALSYSRRNHPVSTQRRPSKHPTPHHGWPPPSPKNFPTRCTVASLSYSPHSTVSRPTLFRSTQIRSTAGDEGIPLSLSLSIVTRIFDLNDRWGPTQQWTGKAQ